MGFRASVVCLVFAGLIPPHVMANEAPDVNQVLAGLQKESTPLGQQVYLNGLDLSAPGMDSFGAQMKATSASVVGNYGEAVREFPMGTKIAGPYPDPSQYRADSAADVIARLAAKRQIVMVNEAHHDASTRVLTLALLPKLRAEGYTYFAAEALPEKSEGFPKGYVPQQKGMSYLNEALYAEIIRRAIKLGFIIVPYDFGKMDTNDRREHSQAQNIYKAVFAHDPHAKLFVHAGWGHIIKGDHTKMIEQLVKLSGINPLSVDQTLLRYTPSHAEPFYDRLVIDYPSTVPVVLVNKANGHPYTSEPKNHDITVLEPRVLTGDGRGDWLSLSGQRKATDVNGAPCQSHFPCLVQARYAGDDADAVPADQALLSSLAEQRKLYLRPGAYRLSGMAADGTVLSSSALQVNP